VGAKWAYQVTRLFVDLNQYLDPNGDGQLVNRTQLRLGLDRDLSPTTVLTLGLRGINDDAPPGNNTQGQKYASADMKPAGAHGPPMTLLAVRVPLEGARDARSTTRPRTR
jgi:hypothetical protein